MRHGPNLPHERLPALASCRTVPPPSPAFSPASVRNAGLTPMISIVVLSQVKSLKDQPYTIRMRDNLKNLSDEPCAGTGLRMLVRSVFHI